VGIGVGITLEESNAIGHSVHLAMYWLMRTKCIKPAGFYQAFFTSIFGTIAITANPSTIELSS